jgi:hypothetical protein
MIDITNETQYSIIFADMCARLVGGADVIGVSTGPYGTIVHLVDGASSAVQASINAMFDNIGSLTVLATKSQIDADDSDSSVVTTVTTESTMDYLVLLDGDEYARDSVSVVAGVATVTLATAIEGVYQVIFINPDGSATGEVSIEAVEA